MTNNPLKKLLNKSSGGLSLALCAFPIFVTLSQFLNSDTHAGGYFKKE